MEINPVIMTYPKRMDKALALSHKIEGATVQNDIDSKGALWNSLRSWEVASMTGTHGMLLQDDVELCPHFLTAVYKILSIYPDRFISLYNPYPYASEIQKYNELRGERWSFMESRLFTYGQAWIIPQCRIVQMLRWISKNLNATPFSDPTYNLYFWYNDIEIIAPIHSLVQHVGTKSDSYKANVASESRASIMCEDGIKEKYYKHAVYVAPNRGTKSWVKKWSVYLRSQQA